ncbi:MAG: F0F1 ATP synthase subunit delta [Chloroflexi bacterium]|nr:MAG: F0F1 ATP synthase subunit delta [Chloroflexota bacterium]
MARASARRHAQAAFQIALERGELDIWREDLKRISEAMKDPLLVAFLESPKIRFEEKARILSQRLEGINPLAMNLAFLLVAKGRLRIVDEMVLEYERLLDEHRGIAHAEVATAIPLDSDEKDKLAHRLSRMMGKEIVLTTKVDPSIIGGLIARVDDKLIDGSTKSRLRALRQSLVR